MGTTSFLAWRLVFNAANNDCYKAAIWHEMTQKDRRKTPAILLCPYRVLPIVHFLSLWTIPLEIPGFSAGWNAQKTHPAAQRGTVPSKTRNGSAWTKGCGFESVSWRSFTWDGWRLNKDNQRPALKQRRNEIWFLSIFVREKNTFLWA